jgi:hypothetical protein
MHLRVIKDIGTYKCGQRLTFGNYSARQLIAAGIAVEDEGLEAEAKIDLPNRGEYPFVPDPESEKPTGVVKRRYRRRELTDDE